MRERKIDSPTSISKRKYDHLNTALHKQVQYEHVTTGFEKYRFIHQALPQLDLTTVDFSTTFLGATLRAPLMISSMVGGIDEAGRINRNLAQAAQEMGLAMGVGSQRCAIENSGMAETYRVRDVAPDILLCANLGAIQLNYGYGIDECRRVADMIGADALVLHLNPLQEALQPEGNTNFSGLLEKITDVCRALPVPVIVKEVGFGISEQGAHQLARAGAAAIDIAGAGGTSWSEIERYQAQDENDNNIAGSFATWGLPTAQSLQMAKKGAPSVPLIASGGIRSGLDAAKAIALGADIVGIANPLLMAAQTSADMVMQYLTALIKGLRISMFCTGAGTIEELKHTPLLID